MSELKPCPFCGRKEIYADTEYMPSLNKGMGFVECIAYPCPVIIRANTMEEAIKIWNTRPLENALQAKLDGYVKAYSDFADEIIVLRKQLEEEHAAGIRVTEQWMLKSKQLDIAVEALEVYAHAQDGYFWDEEGTYNDDVSDIAREALAEINKLRKDKK